MPDESFDAIFVAKAFGFCLPMLAGAFNEIGGHADIDCSVAVASEHINAGLFDHRG